MGSEISRELTTDTLAIWFSDNPHLLQLNYSKVLIAVHSNVFTILPDKTEQPRNILETLGYSIKNSDRIFMDEIETDFLLYYTISESIVDFLEHRFQNINWHFGDIGSIKFKNTKLSFKNHLVAHLYGEDLSIALKKDGKLFFFNKFLVKAKEDLLYYIRLSYDQLQLNPNEFATYLYGFIEEKSPAFSTSYGYIRNFEIDRTLKHGLGYLHTDEDIPMHYYINLLALGKCA